MKVTSGLSALLRLTVPGTVLNLGTNTYTFTLSTDGVGTSPVVNGASGSLVLLRIGQDGYTTFSGTAGQILGLGIQSTANAGSGLYTIYKPDGSQLDSQPYSGLGSSKSYNLPILTATGTFTV